MSWPVRGTTGWAGGCSLAAAQREAVYPPQNQTEQRKPATPTHKGKEKQKAKLTLKMPGKFGLWQCGVQGVWGSDLCFQGSAAKIPAEQGSRGMEAKVCEHRSGCSCDFPHLDYRLGGGEGSSLLWGWRARQGFGETHRDPGNGWAGNRAAPSHPQSPCDTLWQEVCGRGLRLVLQRSSLMKYLILLAVLLG